MVKEIYKRILRICLILVLIVVSGYFLLYTEGITGAVVGVEGAEIEKEVFEEIEEDGVVSVIVVLEEDEETSSSDLEEKKDAIKENQEEVLDELNLEEKEGFLGIFDEEKEFEIRHKYSTINAFSGEVTEEGLKKLEKDPKVKKVYFNKVLHVMLDGSVPQIKADDVWELSIKGAGETVCVIDTGIDTDHDAFTGRILDQYCYCRNSGGCCPGGGLENVSAEDDHGHGTHVAGIAAGNHSTYKGVAPEAGIVAIKVCNNVGACDSDDVISAIDWCVSNASKYNISVISMSLGGGGPYNTYCDDNSYGIAPGINSAAAENINVVISSGNNGWTEGISSPACVENATPVGAVNSADSISYNRGDVLELLAPGISITSLSRGGGTTTMSGTSMSAPHAAGAIALVKQYWKSVHGLVLTSEQVEDRLVLTGELIDDSGNNYSRIDVLKAVQPIISFTSDNQEDGATIIEDNTLINVTSDVDLTSALLEWDYGNETVENMTMDGEGTNFYYNMVDLILGDHSYKVYGKDSINTFGISETRTLTVNIEMPNITFYEPLNNSYHNSAFNLNVSITDSSLSYSDYTIRNSSNARLQDNTAEDINQEEFTWNDLVNLSNPVFTDGAYNLSVEAENSLGGSAESIIEFVVDRIGPVISAVNRTPEEVYDDETVVFYVNATDLYLSSVLVESDFSGNLTNYTMSLETGDKFNYSATLSSGGIFNYQFYAFDSAGNVGVSELFNFMVQNRNHLPLINITNPVNGAAVEITSSVQFNVTATDSDGDNLSYIWDFGEETSLEQNPVHQFNDEGEFVVVLNVSDGYGFSLANVAVVVSDSQPGEITSISYDDEVHIESEGSQEVSVTVSDYSSIFDVALYFNDAIKEGTCGASWDCFWNWSGFTTDGNYDFIVEVVDNSDLKNAQNYTYSFDVASCSDVWENGDEEGTDCGGSCPDECVVEEDNETDDSDDSSDDSDGGGSSSGSSGGGSSSSGGGSSSTTAAPTETVVEEIIEEIVESVEEESGEETSFAAPEENLAAGEGEEEEGVEGRMSLTGRAVSFLSDITDWNSKTKFLIGMVAMVFCLLIFYFIVRKKE